MLSAAFFNGLLAQQHRAPDLREAYDVQSYRLDLRIDPAARALSGTVAVRATVVAEPLAELVLDLTPDHRVTAVTSASAPLAFEHVGAQLRCLLPDAVGKGQILEVEVEYERVEPEPLRGGRGRRRRAVLWAKTPSGAPWVGTSCQGPGAHAWWPCKSNYFHPEDKPERVSVSLTVPSDLYAVSNGRLIGTVAAEEGWRTFMWQHDYPLETYTVTANVAPYVVVEDRLELPGVEEPVDFVYYVLPENAEKAAVQFRDVPQMLEIFSEAFGPWPFPRSKFALVETSFWGMEHSTAVAYGSSYPAWCREKGVKDPYAGRNTLFDYILVHESAHEWWGNAVSAADWGHFWIHEGFGTYAEGVYVERTLGREAADEYFDGQALRSLQPKGRLYRGDNPESGDAYSGLIYSKGACVLNTLRHYVDDDDAWWTSLRTFNVRYRFGNATTEDFRSVLEEVTQRDWTRFFDEWFYGAGVPRVSGTVTTTTDGFAIDVHCDANGATAFQVPLDLTWQVGGVAVQRRIWLEPGETHKRVVLDRRPEALEIVGLHRVLGEHDVRVE